MDPHPEDPWTADSAWGSGPEQAIGARDLSRELRQRGLVPCDTHLAGLLRRDQHAAPLVQVFRTRVEHGFTRAAGPQVLTEPWIPAWALAVIRHVAGRPTINPPTWCVVLLTIMAHDEDDRGAALAIMHLGGGPELLEEFYAAVCAREVQRDPDWKAFHDDQA